MIHKLYSEVELLTDVSKFGLKAGDVVKVVDYAETNYVLEAFNVLGDTIGVFILPENKIKALAKNKVFNTRNIELV